MYRIQSFHCILLLLVASASAGSVFSSRNISASRASLLTVRGGDQPKKHRKKHKSKSRSKRTKSSSDISKAISDDPAKMMGDAIRARSSELLEDDLTHPRNTNHGNTMFSSLSYAIGTSEQQNNMDDGGGVEPPASAVIANYFLKSHGGVHGVQSLTSLFAVLFGMGAYFTPSANLGLKVRLMQRTLICALAKHLSGFIGAATMSAGSIPDIGWRQTRIRIESLALDPVAQYLFYCALLIVWSNGAVATSVGTVPGGAKVAAKTAATTMATNFPWWLKDNRWRPLCLTCILAPIMVREVVSTLWVLADVLVLYHSAKSSDSSPAILSAGKGLLDAIMSLLLTPKTWRNANAQERQKLLAKLVGKTSLGFEVGTCLILLYDAMRGFLDFSVAPVTSRPSIFSVAKRIVCARLMVNFMLVRRKKVLTLLTDIRGGASQVPGRVLDCLLEPSKAMGFETDISNDYASKSDPKTLANWASLILDF